MASAYASLAIAAPSVSSPKQVFNTRKNASSFVVATKKSFIGGSQLKVSKLSAPSGRRSVTVWAAVEPESSEGRPFEKAGEFLDKTATKAEEVKDELVNKAKDSADYSAKKNEETKDYVAGQVEQGLDALKDAISDTHKESDKK